MIRYSWRTPKRFTICLRTFRSVRLVWRRFLVFGPFWWIWVMHFALWLFNSSKTNFASWLHKRRTPLFLRNSKFEYINILFGLKRSSKNSDRRSERSSRRSPESSLPLIVFYSTIVLQRCFLIKNPRIFFFDSSGSVESLLSMRTTWTLRPISTNLVTSFRMNSGKLTIKIIIFIINKTINVSH